MCFFQHVLSLRERPGQLDAWLERSDAVVVPGGHGAVFAQPGASGRVLAKGRVMVSWPRVADRLYGAIPLLGHYMVPYREPVAVTLERAGASVLDSMLASRARGDRRSPCDRARAVERRAVRVRRAAPAGQCAGAGGMSRGVETFPFWTNWNRNLTFRPEQLARPDSLEALSRIIVGAAGEGRTVRPVGAGISYTPLVQTDHLMLSLDAFSGVERVDAAAGTAVVGAGTRLGTLARELARHGLALANLGDIDRQTVAGAVATGTHGTGITIGSLSSQIVAMTIVDGTGRVRQLDADRAGAAARRASGSVPSA
jgi:hypothetical protein